MAAALRVLPAARRAIVAAPRQTVTQTTASVWRAGARRSFAARAALLEKKYTPDHEWVEMDADGKIGTIGITEYAAKALGDVVYAELPEVGLEVAQGETIGAVESVKSASDILAPVSGTVREANEALADKPALLNSGPEGDAWFAKIELADVKELDALMDKAAYDAYEK